MSRLRTQECLVDQQPLFPDCGNKIIIIVLGVGGTFFSLNNNYLMHDIQGRTKVYNHGNHFVNKCVFLT